MRCRQWSKRRSERIIMKMLKMATLLVMYYAPFYCLVTWLKFPMLLGFWYSYVNRLGVTFTSDELSASF